MGRAKFLRLARAAPHIKPTTIKNSLVHATTNELGNIVAAIKFK